MNRLAEQKSRDAAAYGIMDLMNDTRSGVFTTANGNSSYGRTLQAAYVEALTGAAHQRRGDRDVKAGARANLKAIQKQLNSGNGNDALVQGHRDELNQHIRVALIGLDVMTGK